MGLFHGFRTWRLLSGHLSTTSGSHVFWSRTMIQNTPARPPPDGFRKPNEDFELAKEKALGTIKIFSGKVERSLEVPA